MSERNRWQPWLLLLVYVGPLIAASALYLAGWRPTREPHGQLLAAPQQLPETALTTPAGVSGATDMLQHRWSLIYAPQTQCGVACVERLNRINQVRLALGKDMGRAQVVLLYSGAPPALPEGAEVVLGRLDDAAGRLIDAFLNEHTSADSRIYLSDPLGRLVMAYSPDIEQNGLLEDLERLLAVQ